MHAAETAETSRLASRLTSCPGYPRRAVPVWSILVRGVRQAIQSDDETCVPHTIGPVNQQCADDSDVCPLTVAEHVLKPTRIDCLDLMAKKQVVSVRPPNRSHAGVDDHGGIE